LLDRGSNGVAASMPGISHGKLRTFAILKSRNKWAAFAILIVTQLISIRVGTLPWVSLCNYGGSRDIAEVRVLT